MPSTASSAWLASTWIVSPKNAAVIAAKIIARCVLTQQLARPVRSPTTMTRRWDSAWHALIVAWNARMRSRVMCAHQAITLAERRDALILDFPTARCTTRMLRLLRTVRCVHRGILCCLGSAISAWGAICVRCNFCARHRARLGRVLSIMRVWCHL